MRIAVQLQSDLVTPGEFLADVRAYEAAGAGAVWLAPAALEPLTLAAAALAVTSRIEVVAWVGAPGRWPPELLGAVARTLTSLGRDQVGFGVAGAAEEAAGAIAALQAAHPAIVVYVDGEHARGASGQVRDLAVAADHFERTRA